MTSSQVAFTSGMDDADAAGETGIDGATGGGETWLSQVKSEPRPARNHKGSQQKHHN